MKSSAGQPEPQKCSAVRPPLQAPAEAGSLLRATVGMSGRSPDFHAIYIHIPFCFHKCHYCDFYSIVDDRDRQRAFAQRLVGEARSMGRIVGAAPRAVFVGGGTPTLLRAELWVTLLDALHESFNLSSLAEFTVEANPETVSPELLSILGAGGVNRISIGAQSFDQRHLKTLERWHDPGNVEKAITLARAVGIDNINLDLIFAIPGQTLEDWRADLQRALELQPTHLSCYSLMFEPNTPLTQKLRQGKINRAPEELEARMFECTIDTLTAAGFEHYEISNFALPGRRCQHNLVYWHNENWLALGPSASGHLDGVRWKNAPHLGRYLASEGPAPIQDVERLEAGESLGEQLMLRLRLIEGVDNQWIEERLDVQRRDALNCFAEQGLVQRTASHTRLTRHGLMVADTILAELL